MEWGGVAWRGMLEWMHWTAYCQYSSKIEERFEGDTLRDLMIESAFTRKVAF